MEVCDSLHPLLKHNIPRLDSILEMHDCMDTGVHLLTGKVNLLSSIVQPVLGLAKVVVRDRQLQILLCRLTCSTAEEGILALQPFYHA
jgi:hypothetical protein